MQLIPFDSGNLCARLLLCGLAAALVSTPGLAERPRVYAITGAHVVTAPGQVIESGTVVIRDGLIDAAGSNVEPPTDAVEIDGDGLWVYPGLIDPNTTLGQRSAGGSPPSEGGGGSSAGRSRGQTAAGPVHPLSRVRPETRTRDVLLPFDGDRKREAERYRELGYTAVLTVPESGVFRGTSSVILLIDEKPVPELLLQGDVAQHLAFERGRFGQGYPTSLMGAVAAIRQVLLDAERHAVWTARYARDPKGMPRPEQLAALESLGVVISGSRPAFFHAESPADVLLAHRVASEFELDAAIVASGHEWEIAEQIRDTGRTLILPVAFPDKPKLDDEDERLETTTRDMRRYLEAPGAAARLDDAGVTLAFTTKGLKTLSNFRKNLRKIIDAGLAEDKALAALTTVPAALLGIDSIAGTIEPGKIANLAVFDGPIFGEETKVKRVFVDGIEYKMKEKKELEGADPNAVVDPRGEWAVVFEFGRGTIERSWTLEGQSGNYTGSAETQRGTVEFEEVTLAGNVLTVIYPARGGRGSTEVTVVIQGDSFEGQTEMGPRTVPIKGTRTSKPQGGER